MAIINIVIRICCQILLQRRRILMIMQIKSTIQIRGYVRCPPVYGHQIQTTTTTLKMIVVATIRKIKMVRIKIVVMIQIEPE